MKMSLILITRYFAKKIGAKLCAVPKTQTIYVHKIKIVVVKMVNITLNCPLLRKYLVLGFLVLSIVRKI